MANRNLEYEVLSLDQFLDIFDIPQKHYDLRRETFIWRPTSHKKLSELMKFSDKPQGPSDGDKTKNTGNDESVGCMSIAGALTIENSNGVSIGNTTLDLSGISEAVLGIGKQILKVVEDGMNQFLTLISKLLSSSLENRRLKRCINKIK